MIQMCELYSVNIGKLYSKTVFKKRSLTIFKRIKAHKDGEGEGSGEKGGGLLHFSYISYMGIRPSQPSVSQLWSVLRKFQGEEEASPPLIQHKISGWAGNWGRKLHIHILYFFHFLFLYIQTYTVLEVIEEKVKILSRKDDIYKGSRKTINVPVVYMGRYEVVLRGDYP